MASVVTGASRMVWPSGAARAAACAGTILDHHRPLELVLELLREQAGEDVGAPAGRKRAEKGHRALRIIFSRCLRPRCLDRSEAEHDGGTERDSPFHVPPLPARMLFADDVEP